jgi:hypothetical protein
MAGAGGGIVIDPKLMQIPSIPGASDPSTMSQIGRFLGRPEVIYGMGAFGSALSAQNGPNSPGVMLGQMGMNMAQNAALQRDMGDYRGQLGSIMAGYSSAPAPQPMQQAPQPQQTPAPQNALSIPELPRQQTMAPPAQQPQMAPVASALSGGGATPPPFGLPLPQRRGTI